MIHMALFITAFASLPMSITFEPPTNTESPLLWQIATMFGMIGLPFFVLSTSAPLLQKWFSLSTHPNADNPYFLYAASNIGSVLALLLYPVVIEYFLPLPEQTRGFQIGFLMLGVSIAICGLSLGKNAKKIANDAHDNTTPAPDTKTIATWIFLAFVPSSLMLGFTTFITNDVGATPLFWIIPLTLYIVSFIVAFSRQKFLTLNVTKPLYLLMFAVCTFHLTNVLGPQPWLVALSNGILFFLTATMCHQQLNHMKPKTDHMTLFFLMLSIGGALGGIFNALIAPVIFLKAYEFMVATALGLLCWGIGIKQNKWFLITPILFFMLLLPPIPWQIDGLKEISRNYFGTLVVSDNGKVINLIHGNTVHGTQSIDPKFKTIPLTYYNPETGIGHGFSVVLKHKPDVNVAGLGMGTGSISCLLRPKDNLTFFEIDHDIIRIATDKNLFSYTSDCKTPYSIVQGDARLKLKESPDNSFDLTLVDVFSGDNIPMHLLTVEAASLYMQKTKKDGMIIFHISNRYMRLEQEVGLIAKSLDINAYHKMTPKGPIADTKFNFETTNVVILTNNPVYQKDLLKDGWQLMDSPNTTLHPWTDTYANLFRVLFRGQSISSP